jgi:hypothetical protein
MPASRGVDDLHLRGMSKLCHVLTDLAQADDPQRPIAQASVLGGSSVRVDRKRNQIEIERSE